MVLVETEFPRGGTVKKRQDSESIDFGAKHVKKRKIKSKIAKDQEETIEDEVKIEATCAELLTYKTIQEGMLLFGVIRHVDSICLKVSLPGRIIGKVYASEISDSYNKVLKEFISDNITLANFKPLEKIYSVGQSVYAKVMEVKENESKTRVEVLLSMKPVDIHANLYHENIKKGMVLYGSVEEIQDHGYIIESGIKNLRCFVPIENISNDLNICIGENIFVKIHKLQQFKNSSTAICRIITKESDFKIKDQVEPRLDYLMPSTVVNFTVTKILKDGLQGTIMNENFTAYVNEHQLRDLFSKPEDYDINKKIPAKILYIMPLSKLVYLSLKQTERFDEDEILKRGTVTEAVVNHIGTGGIIFKISDTKKAVLSFRTIRTSCLGNYDHDAVLLKYPQNSKHKIRIIDYDYVDQFHICSDEKKLIEEKYFTLEDCQAGEFVTAAVHKKDLASGSLFFKLGHCSALMEKIFQSTSTFLTATENTKIKCRIMGVNFEKNIAYLTNRPEYMKSDARILLDTKKCKINETYLGTVVKCTETYLIVKFFNGIKGILYKTNFSNFLSTEFEIYSPGQTVLFKILKIEGDKLLLTLANELFKIGDVYEAKVENCLETGLEISLKTLDKRQFKGLVLINLISDFPELTATKLKSYLIGQPIDVACYYKNIFSVRDVDYFKGNPVKTFDSLKPGDILRGAIKNIQNDVVEVLLPIKNFNKLLRIHLKMILPKLTMKPDILVEPDQLIYVKILSKDFKTKSLTVSAKLTDLWNCDFNATGVYFEKYLSEVKHLKKFFKSQNHSLGNLSFGDIIEGTVSLYLEETSDIYVDLGNGIQGIIKKHLLYPTNKTTNQHFKVGDKMEVIILWIDYTNEFVYCSNQLSLMKKILKTSKLPQNLVGKLGVNAKILLVFSDFIICSLKRDQNPLIFVPKRLHYNDFEASVTTTKVIEGDFCKLCFIYSNQPIAVFEETMKIWNNYKSQKRKCIELEGKLKKKRKLMESNLKLETCETTMGNTEFAPSNELKNMSEMDKAVITFDFEKDIDEGVDDETKSEEFSNTSDEMRQNETKEGSEVLIKKLPITRLENSKSKKRNINSETPKLLPGAEDFWSTTIDDLSKNDNIQSSSEDEDFNDSVNTKKLKKKRNTEERLKIEKTEEARIREIESKYANLNNELETSDQYDRLVLSEPNDSRNWIKYMVYYLQTTEVDKARAVAKRALKAISFREQQELLNVWIALLNLESTYGTKENFNDTLKEALLCNDSLKIYLRVIEILTNPKKIQELTEVIGTVTKKFKENADVWKQAGSAYFQVGLKEKGQQLLHRAIASLPEREHVNIIAAFAGINHKYGEKENAHTLLEQVLTSYPKRVDIWSQYIDMLIKDNLIEAARRTLERSVVQKIPLKKMRTLFKKFLEFEEKYGDETSVLKVKELAQNYIKTET